MFCHFNNLHRQLFVKQMQHLSTPLGTFVISQKNRFFSRTKGLDRHWTCAGWSPGWPASWVFWKSRSNSKFTWYGHFCDFTNRFFSHANGWIVTKLAHDGLQVGQYRLCAQVQGQRSHDVGTFVISQKSKIASSPRLDHEQTHSFANLPFPFSIPFSSTPQIPNCYEFAL